MPRLVPIAVAASLAVAVPATTRAQDYTYRTVTRAEYGGALGRIVNIMPGGPEPIEETTYVHGGMMRVDRDESSTILDLDNFSFTHLDHPARTYYTFRSGDISEMWTQTEVMTTPPDEYEMDAARKQNVNYDVSFNVDRTGETRTIAGFETERVFLTLQIEATEIEPEDPADPQGGTLVTLTEMWLTPDFPPYRMLQERQSPPAKGAKPGGSQAAFDYDPRIQVAMERFQEEMAEMEGFSLRTVTHFVAVPIGLEFDRQKVLDDADRSLIQDVAAAAASSAVSSARRRVGGLTGRLGRGRNSEPEPPPPEQVVFMRSIVEVQDFTESALDPALFAPPADYTESSMGG